MMKRIVTQALVAVCMAAVGAPALAAATINASLANWQITLTDLNPGDGIAPSISFLPGGYDVASLSAGTASSPYLNQFTFIGTGNFSPFSGNATATNAHASGSLIGDGTFTGTQSWNLSASANATQLGESRVAAGYITLDNLHFSITPGTGVELTSTLTVNAHSQSTASSTQTRTEYGSLTLTTLGVWPGGEGGSEPMLVGDTFTTHYDSQTPSLALMHGMSLYILNSGPREEISNIAVTLQADAQSALTLAGPQPPMVPEPATYGMLLSGLGLLGVAARRRTRR